MNGILLIDKPEGITSHDVVGKLRRILKIKRIGHTGTLDPFATGLMVMLIGKAIRLAQFLDKDVKEYSAIIQFGAETDTGDRTGTVTKNADISNTELSKKLLETDWQNLISQFTGNILQIPPMYSAKKIGGKKLYEIARSGQEIERKPLPVTIYSLEISAIDAEQLTMQITVKCSAGTFIRTLAEDIGKAAGCPAHLQQLRRKAAGKFKIENSLTLERSEDLQDLNDNLLSMSSAVDHLPELELSNERAAKTLNGMSTRISGREFTDGDIIRMNSTGVLLAIGVFNAAENSVRPTIVLGV